MSEIHSVEREELMAYIDGELTARRIAEIAAHIEGCAGCREFVADLQSVSRRVQVWQIEPADATVPSRVVAALGKHDTPPRRRFFPVWSRWVLGTATILVAVVAVQLSRLRVQPLPPQQSVAFMMASAPSTNRMVERQARLVLLASDFDKARNALDAIVLRHGGYIGNLTVSSANARARTLDATLRVPAAGLNSALTELKTLGHVEEESQSGEDVTAQYVDLEAHLANAHNTESRLSGLLRDRTGKLSDVLEVERELSRVRGEIEEMEAQRKSLANLVEFATVSVKLSEDSGALSRGASKPALMRWRNAAADGYRSATEGVVDAIALLFSYGPGLLLWAAVLYFPARFAWKKVGPQAR